MHATPSEAEITPALHGECEAGVTVEPPKRLTASYLKPHSGDRHRPSDDHGTVVEPQAKLTSTSTTDSQSEILG